MRPVWILAGATATGKTAVAQSIAESTGAAIVSADSMLVYSGMDIGTAKPTAAERGDVPYFGIDLATPDQPFSTGAWLAAVRAQIATLPPPSPADAAEPGHGIIVAGGTGLYIRALIDGIDAPRASAASREHWNAVLASGGVEALQSALRERAPSVFATMSESDRINPRRLTRALEIHDADACADSATCGVPAADAKQPPRIAVLSIEPATLGARIARRIERMFADGLLDEAERLRATYPALSDTAAAAIGYAEAFAVLNGSMSRDEAAERIAARTRQLAKRQRTWFRHQVEATPINASSGDVRAIANATIAAWRTTGPMWIPCGETEETRVAEIAQASGEAQ